MPKRISLLAIAAMAVWAIACGDSGNTATDGTDGVSASVANVESMPVVKRDFEEYILVTGTVKAGKQATVSAEEPGVIEAFERDRGQKVSQGDIVVRLRADFLKASYQEAEAAYKLAEDTAKRQKNLYEDRSISEQQYLNAKYNRDMARARLDQLAARLARTEIRSPISGVIDARLAERGEYVLPGQQLFEVLKTDTVKIEAGIPERYVPDLKKDASATVVFGVYPDRAFEGRIRFVGASVDSDNRTFPVEVELANSDNLIKPEMLARLKILKHHWENVTVVPRDAVIERENEASVFVVADDIARKRTVETGPSEGDRVVLLSGVSPGEQLVVVGHRDLTDGERVRILKQHGLDSFSNVADLPAAPQ